MFTGLPDSKTPLITAGFIQLIAEQGIGTWVDPDEPYDDSVDPAGIFLGEIPPDAESGIGINPYPVMMDTEPGVDVMGIQVMVRNRGRRPDEALAVADRLEETFHGISHQNFGGYNIPLIWRNSLAALGPNDNGNYQLTDNYYMYIDVYRKAAENG